MTPKRVIKRSHWWFSRSRWKWRTTRAETRWIITVTTSSSLLASWQLQRLAAEIRRIKRNWSISSSCSSRRRKISTVELPIARRTAKSSLKLALVMGRRNNWGSGRIWILLISKWTSETNMQVGTSRKVKGGKASSWDNNNNNKLVRLLLLNSNKWVVKIPLRQAFSIATRRNLLPPQIG